MKNKKSCAVIELSSTPKCLSTNTYDALCTLIDVTRSCQKKSRSTFRSRGRDGWLSE